LKKNEIKSSNTTENMKKQDRGYQHSVKCANGLYKSIRLTRKLAMSIFCTECMGFEGDPMDCTAKTCPLYPWRKKTYITRVGNSEKPI